MLHPRATSAGLADTGAIVSLGGWDSVFPIRLAAHLQRLCIGTQRVLLSVFIRARTPVEPLRCLAAVDRAARKPLLAMAELLAANFTEAPA